MEKNVIDFFRAIEQSKRIVFLTGAGVSTDSSIKDFRSEEGLWTKDRNREDYMSKSYFNRRPKKFWTKYKEIFDLKEMMEKIPNQTHFFLSELERAGKEIHVLTQNVDGLHQKAGSKQVIEIHGNIQTATCPKCKTVYQSDYLLMGEIPRCSKTNGKGKVCSFILYPDAVLFGDKVRGYKEAEKLIEEADLFVVMGTSLLVKPVNQLPKTAFLSGVKSIYLNREQVEYTEASENDYDFDITLLGELSEIFDKWCEWKTLD